MKKEACGNFSLCFDFKILGKVFFMDGISEVSQANSKNNVNITGGKNSPAVPVKTAPLPNDSVELSSKKENKSSDFGKIAAMLGMISLAVAGATFGGIKVFDRYFQKLHCGIKKGEINDALFNFIRKNDISGRRFNDKEKILKIDENLTDENFLILKQLTKMQDENSKRWGLAEKRFSLDEITELLTGTNEFNIKYLEQLAKKSDTRYNYTTTFKAGDMLPVLKNITPDNEKVVKELIEITKIDNSEELVKCLQGINKDNVDVYQMLLSTRRKGGSTELSLEDIQSVAKWLEKTKNPQCAEFFLNAETNNGTGLFRYSMEDIDKLLKIAKEENLDTYKKLYDLKCTADVESGMIPLLKSVTDDNINLVEPLLTKKENSELLSQYVIFKNWDNIGNVLKSVDKKNKDCASQIIDIIDSRRYKKDLHYNYGNVDEYLPELFEELSKNPEKLKLADDILKKGIVDEKQTLDFQAFYDKYKNINRKSDYPDIFPF